MHRVLLIPLLAAVVGCTTPPQTRWVHPDKPREQWSADYRACDRWALHEAEDQYLPPPEAGPDTGPGMRGGSERFRRDMDLYRTRDLRQELRADCLRARGYRKRPAGEAE